MDYTLEREERFKLTIGGKVSISLDGPTVRWFQIISDNDRAMVCRLLYTSLYGKEATK